MYTPSDEDRHTELQAEMKIKYFVVFELASIDYTRVLPISFNSPIVFPGNK